MIKKWTSGGESEFLFEFNSTGSLYCCSPIQVKPLFYFRIASSPELLNFDKYSSTIEN